MLSAFTRAAALRAPVRCFAAAATVTPATAAAPSKHMKRYVLLGSVGLSLLSSAPLVYYVKGLLEREVPPYAAGLKGTWVAATPDGSRWAMLKVNAHGMALYQSSDGANFRGPVSYAPDAITIEPIVSWFGAPKSLSVASWPQVATVALAADGDAAAAPAVAAAAAPAALVIEGLAFQRAPA